MKNASLAVIGMGLLSLVVAVVGRFGGLRLFSAEPIKYIHLASCLFLLSVALMCHARFFGAGAEKK